MVLLGLTHTWLQNYRNGLQYKVLSGQKINIFIWHIYTRFVYEWYAYKTQKCVNEKNRGEKEQKITDLSMPLIMSWKINLSTTLPSAIDAEEK